MDDLKLYMNNACVYLNICSFWILFLLQVCEFVLPFSCAFQCWSNNYIGFDVSWFVIVHKLSRIKISMAYRILLLFGLINILFIQNPKIHCSVFSLRVWNMIFHMIWFLVIHISTCLQGSIVWWNSDGNNICQASYFSLLSCFLPSCMMVRNMRVMKNMMPGWWESCICTISCTVFIQEMWCEHCIICGLKITWGEYTLFDFNYDCNACYQ